ncbi:myeloid-associated differentiation marker homolog [Pangasianodon hypophthalmus]|uniref:myeloid-associated differentiation marker homolog n=1 Tax=Pangasianodon hypophthalmus TaxID=310915 RepID=UPI000F00844B|nr:myeloid-associated differentiation marker homolog [Pangasianodon hypophthalmus]
MPVTFGELSTLTTPLSVARLCALFFSCLTLSLVSSVGYTSESPSLHTFYSFCMVIWCLFFVLTFLVVVIHFIQFHNLLPLSWKNLTATVAALGMLMTFSASFAFIWTIAGQHESKRIVAAVGSCLTSLAYAAELQFIRSQNDGHQRGYMATVPGLLKLLQVFGGCIALVLLNIQPEPSWRTCVSNVTYSVCLLPSVGTVLVMLMDCAGRSPVPFDRLLASFSLLGVIMYTAGTVVCFTRALEQYSGTKKPELVFIMSETVMACITLLAYTVDLAFSVKLLCDRN